MELIDELLADGKERMAKSVDSTRGEFITVRTGPGQMALTVMPSRATSSARVRVRPSNPCLLAA